MVEEHQVDDTTGLCGHLLDLSFCWDGMRVAEYVSSLRYSLAMLLTLCLQLAWGRCRA